MFNTKNIKKIRNNLNKSQEEMAKILNISRTSYAMWESNNDIIPISRLIEFCEIFKVSINYVIGLTDKYEEITTKANKELLCLRLKEFRKNNHLTQEKLATILNTNKSVICNYEKGRNIIATPFLYTICNKYQISADYLFGRTNNPTI